MSIKELLNKQYLNLGKDKKGVPRSPTGNYVRGSLMSLRDDELSQDLDDLNEEEEEAKDNSLDNELEAASSP